MKFVRHNQRMIALYAAFYLGVTGLVMAVTASAGSISAPPASAEASGTDALILFLGIVPLAASLAMLAGTLWFFRAIVGSYRNVRTRFGPAAAMTIRTYIGRFFKATLIFFPIGILAGMLYILLFNPDIQNFASASSDLGPFYLVLMTVYQVLFAIVTFNVIFVPLVSVSTNALSYRQTLDACRSLVRRRPNTLKRLFVGYQTATILVSLAAGILENPLHLGMLSAFMAVVEILWAVVLAWQFMSINIERETEAGAGSGFDVPMTIPEQTGVDIRSDAEVESGNVDSLGE
ncbi:MAG: hypothetical protein EWM51_04140 [Treponema sp.]|nr:MAG: hypothetical protein EWM51_04140 [Treponema sp.]